MTANKVHNFTAERAKRGTLPWDFTIDVAADRFEISVYQGARPLDGIAMAKAASEWSRALEEMARGILSKLQPGRRRVVEELCQQSECPRGDGMHWHPLSVASFLEENDGEYAITVRVRTIRARRAPKARKTKR